MSVIVMFYFRHLHADEVLDGRIDSVAGLVRDKLEPVRVLDHQGDVDRYLRLSDFHADALGEVFLADLFTQGSQRTRCSAAEGVHSFDFLDRDAGDLCHNAVCDSGRTAAVDAWRPVRRAPRGGLRGGRLRCGRLRCVAGPACALDVCRVCVWVVCVSVVKASLLIG